MEEAKNDPNLIWNIVIFISVGVIITLSIIVVMEVKGAKKFCDEMGEEFNLDLPSRYYCDTIPIYKYNTGWDYEKEIKEVNLSNIMFP